MTAVDVDALEAARAAIGDSPAFSVVGFEQDAEDVLAIFDDGGKSVFAECYGTDAAALIAESLAALPDLLAAVRERDALRAAVEGLAESLTAATRDVGELSPEYRKHCGWHADLLRAALATVDPS